MDLEAWGGEEASGRLCALAAAGLKEEEEGWATSWRATIRVDVGRMKDGCGNWGGAVAGDRVEGVCRLAVLLCPAGVRADAGLFLEKSFSNRSMPLAMAEMTAAGRSDGAIRSAARSRVKIKSTRGYDGGEGRPLRQAAIFV